MTLAYIGIACLAASVVLLSWTVLRNSMQANKAKKDIDLLVGAVKANAKQSAEWTMQLDRRMNSLDNRVSELERKVRGDSDR